MSVSTSQPVRATFRDYLQLTRLNKPIGLLLLLWPTWWALLLAAQGLPQPKIALIFTAGVVLMRSAGCAINDYFDRDIDGAVERTANRPIAQGRIPPSHALWVAAVLSLISLLLVLQLNRLTIQLAIIAAALAATYPLFKRFTYLPQAYLGVAFGWGIPMAFAAVQGTVPAIAWLLLLANIFWTVAYDTQYAMVDRADDLTIGVRSTAILFGQDDCRAVAILQVSALVTLLLVGLHPDSGLNGLFYLFLTGAAGLSIYFQRLIKDRDRQRCLQAFLRNNWWGALIFAGIFLDLLGGPQP
ncbi:MAG: 4-hydroxybenzoate octaprenyltransferase [Gammaproteobacteria bacterium]|nr:MAG: 4-hydroxybenzoate octaprenyltransferase [Gammaproteobacteria bacterium]RLA15010.1 MAG: 4-hydroxybenzoate octaprenyltransferase [Gammaproteobacteria bacterium]RLA18229.1 MAG: 4-hydroxybenzoate octaprenyltransferase [Gammaproteobacteria bacterium]